MTGYQKKAVFIGRIMLKSIFINNSDVQSGTGGYINFDNTPFIPIGDCIFPNGPITHIKREVLYEHLPYLFPR